MRDQLAYLHYVARHKWFVWRAGRPLGVRWWQALLHDWSKLLPSEWAAYRRNFYRPDGSHKAAAEVTAAERLAFNYAWNHHQKRQPHHWQYWLLERDDGETESLEMPEVYVREMVADWIGAGRAITGKNDVRDWYGKNRDKMLLHYHTRARVEALLNTATVLPFRQPVSQVNHGRN